MIVGNVGISTCTDCPAYKWAGHSAQTGDRGYYCGYGSYKGRTKKETKIPSHCPLIKSNSFSNNLSSSNPLIELSCKIGNSATVTIHTNYEGITLVITNSKYKVNYKLSENQLNNHALKHICLMLWDEFKQYTTSPKIIKPKIPTYQPHVASGIGVVKPTYDSEDT